ncbi:ribonuclease H2 complex subunit Rnh201 [Schizosaccharomyces cryophilus OY26]|uniref:Ribonuclease n=1 Tax=Schizosaccharomyces cryophilus (strain OY26 / ATCC MYA-4695 / CBS 11777 / NBRC 106824 / NRRL Y48691) TaxID=653667 RepID=S9W143_SCHCR|nr:ribonuclease H2 complex subunit Rnh201 [Schizosaccharomyces cryophilus OY26]EPY51800.1 ribonuclease H2 complex subunit Rnh201 [Schizosaccharomyces cryophilus OY26]
MKKNDETTTFASPITEESDTRKGFNAAFVPPSIDTTTPEKSNYFHTTIAPDVPKDQPFRLGVDEAGRGPVLGPMVYAVAYCPVDFDLTHFGFADSKTLTSVKRSQLLQDICNTEDELGRHVGWSVQSISAQELAAGMLRLHNKYNLNSQAHDTTMDLIQKVYDSGVRVTEIYVDTVGPPDTYQQKLQARFPQAKVKVTKKADSLFPIVSLASICAKVTRDIQLELVRYLLQTQDWGSGYSADARTTKWLRSSVHPVFGWKGDIVRYSWQTARDILEVASSKTSSPSFVDVDWHEETSAPLNFTIRKPSTKNRSWFGTDFVF